MADRAEGDRKPRAAPRCCRISQNLYASTSCCSPRASSAARSISIRPRLTLVFNAHGKIEQIVPGMRNDAHKLIEECMLAANVCAADFLRDTSIRRCIACTPARRRKSSRLCASSCAAPA